MTPVWLSLRAGLRRGWRPWLALALLLGTPHRYGQNSPQTLDLEFGAVPARLLDRIVSAQPGVSGYAYGNYGQLNVDGQPVAAVGLAPIRGRGYLTMVPGRLPAGPGQIALGARTLHWVARMRPPEGRR